MEPTLDMMKKIKGQIGKYNNKRIDWSKLTVSDKPMNGEEIVEDIYMQTGVRTSRMNISNALKSAMRSFYKSLSKMEPDLSPFQIASLMLQMLYNPQNDKEFRGGVESFFRLFPNDIRNEIGKDAQKYFNNMKEEKI
jgi:hypothetical protein